MPSSTFTSMTLPVIFDDTVARRRAVTYPDAFSTAACAPAARTVTVATDTSTGRSRVKYRHAPAPITANTTSTSAHPTHRLDPARMGSRSMRSAASSSFRSAMVPVPGREASGASRVSRISNQYSRLGLTSQVTRPIGALR